MNKQNFTYTLISQVLKSKLPLFLIIMSMFAGFVALTFTPREEEPQIVVPMVDIVVSAQGVNAKQVERLITTPLEKLLSQIDGVEHVYSTTVNGRSIVTLRFFVGQDRERAILNTYNKLHSNTDKIPEIVSDWIVRPVEVDDVPIMLLGLWSDNASTIDDYGLRRLAEEVSTIIQGIEDTSEVKIIGGRSRAIQINLDPEQMAARQTSIQEIFNAIKQANTLKNVGQISLGNQSIMLESGDTYRSKEALEGTPINVIDGHVVKLKDVATIIDGPNEPRSYTWIDFTSSHENFSTASSDYPMVTISVAKQKGSNAVTVTKLVNEKIAELSNTVFPSAAHVEVLRDYGETANDKVNSLTTSLAFAVFTVVVFIGVFLGWRSALVVGLAVPICYGITLSLDFAFGYTINRVTLFALILSLGLLVDDPITGVDNIERFMKKGKGSLADKISGAINEIRIPLLMSTLTIVLAFVPLAFITGMMGPYMAPMAFNVPVSVISSTLVAFFITPWLATKFLKTKTNAKNVNSSSESEHSSFESLYRKLLTPLLNDRKKAKWILWGVLALFIAAALLPVLRLVPLKLLPFDNKNEVQIIVDMPESATLESTAAMTKRISTELQKVPEIKAIANYVGVGSPIDFNGLVRQYYLRNVDYNADMRVTLLDKSQREHQSHAVVLRLRELLQPLNINGVNIKVVEVPPGPPVVSTLVAELYGDEFTDYNAIQKASNIVKQRLSQEPHVIEVDSSVQDVQQQIRFVADKTKAALSGVSTADINQVLSVANQGQTVSYMQTEGEAKPLPIVLKLPIEERSSISSLSRLPVKGRAGIVQQSTPQGVDISPQPIVSLAELGEFKTESADKAIFHKDLKPVVYVMADISGRTPGEVIADINADQLSRVEMENIEYQQRDDINNNWQERTFLTSGGNNYWTLPDNINLVWGGEGEWRITVRVFRDMGLAFIFALIAIYFVLQIQTSSSALALIIMSAIPLTVIGIMPGFLILNQFGERVIASAPDPVLFTATAMIGMIALAGIVVRNSLILVEFITQARKFGAPIREALIQAGSVRIRPVLLTAGTTLLGNLIITLDPVFSGLAIAIIFGIISSTVFTLFVVPVVYLLVFEKVDIAVPKKNH